MSGVYGRLSASKGNGSILDDSRKLVGKQWTTTGLPVYDHRVRNGLKGFTAILKSIVDDRISELRAYVRQSQFPFQLGDLVLALHLDLFCQFLVWFWSVG